MAVQDDRREREMCQIIGLRKGKGRSDVDAFFDFELRGKVYSAPIELKSTTSHSVSTARDVGPSHISKWRANCSHLGLMIWKRGSEKSSVIWHLILR